MWDFPSGLRLLMGWKNTVAHTKMLANSIPPHLPIYLYTCPRWSGHPSTPLGCSQGNQGRSSSALLSTQMRVHIHLMVARGVYAHLFSTVWQWAVIDSLENSTGEVCPYRTVLLKLYCAHVSPRDLVSGQVWGRAWEAGFLTHSRMTGQCWSLGHTLSSEAMLCSWVKSQQVRALPWVRVNSGGRKPGNHHLLTLGGWWRGILPAWFSKSPDHCCHLGNFKNIWHQVSPSQELLVSLAWGVAGAYVLPEAPQSICCVELAITAPAVDANGLNDIWRSLSFSSSTSLQIHLVLLSF